MATTPCFQCKGPAHPASGHFWSETVLICGACIRSFFAWVKQHTAPRKKGPDFYREAATSIRAGIFPAPESPKLVWDNTKDWPSWWGPPPTENV